MKKDTIVFLNIYPLGRVFAESLGMDIFAKAGYRLVYLDLSEIYYPGNRNKSVPSNKKYYVKKDFFQKCKTREEVLGQIEKYADRAWFYPLYIRFNLRFDKMWLMRALKKSKCDYILQDFFPLPTGPAMRKKCMTSYFVRVFFQLLKKIQLRELASKIIGWLCFFLMRRDIFFKKPTICFIAGQTMYEQFHKFYPESELVKVPSYDNYQFHRVTVNLRKSGKRIISYDYLLYYDQCLFDSPDGKLLGRNLIEKEFFLHEINNFFDRIEQVAGKKVVIAGSPKYTYDGSEFNGREIFYELTAELTYSAELVIMHTTTAMNFAVAMDKPILFLTMKGFNEYLLEDIQNMASYLNRPIMDADENIDNSAFNDYLKIDDDTYKNYVHNYMATELFVNSPAEVMLDVLLNINNNGVH